MSHRRLVPIVAVVLAALSLCRADDGKNKTSAGGEMDATGRIAIVRAFNGELVYVHKPFPMGEKGLVITADGKVTPDGKELEAQLAMNGAAANVGDRARITDIVFKGKTIIFEINGGPKHKKKWYQRIEVGGAGGTTPVAQQPDEFAKGSFVALRFDTHVPRLDPAEVKQRLASVLDFNAKSSLEAYVESIPPKAKQAIKNHQVLVGMNHQMVLYSIGKPPKKIREKDGESEYEEWIYGEPPQEVKFIRFVGDEVTRVELMTVDGKKLVRTEKEIDLAQEQAQQAAAAAPATPPAKAPTLRRPGEQPEGSGGLADPAGPRQPGGMKQDPKLPPPPGIPQPGDPGGPPP